MIKVWAHTSIAGGIQNIFQRSADIWGNAFQIFAKSPRWWFFGYENITESVVLDSLSQKKNLNQEYWMIHWVYLVNLAKNFDEAQNDINSVIDDFKIAHKLGLQSVNVHLWKYWKLTKQQAFQNMSDNMNKILDYANQTDVLFLFENTSGQGTEIGWNFEELAELSDFLKNKLWKWLVENKVRFCLDTAHLWWAWYDINDFENVLEQFDKNLWLEKLMCFHLNDTKVPLWSKLDRHANLGKGFIWIKALSKVIKWANQNDVPIILETPDNTLRAEEIKIIKWIASWTFDEKLIEDFHKKHFKTEYLKKFESFSKGESLF